MLLESLAKLLESARHDGTITRASIGVVLPGEPPIFHSIGELDDQKISERTLFDVASVTKLVPVSTLALRAIDQGVLQLETPISHYVPDLALRCTTVPTIFHLLTQTLDFGYSLAGLKDYAPEELLEKILSAELRTEPGTSFSYCNATSIILGLVVEKVYGIPLDEAAQKFIFDPLQMNDTCFRPAESIQSTIVPTEFCQWRNRMIQGEIHDESAWRLNQKFIPGAAGLFSNVADLCRYISNLTSDTNQLFSAGFIRNCARNYIPHTSDETGLGFEFNQPYMGKNRSQSTIGKTGFTGSVIIADLDRSAGFALLTDYTWPKRKSSKDAIIRLRQSCADALWNAIDHGVFGKTGLV